MVKHLVKQYQEKHKNDDCKVVYCKDCKYLDIEDGGMYATCAKAYKGMVQPWDSCGKGLGKIKDEN